jgi:hypothetical protein
MFWLLRNKDTHVVHDAVQEGGGGMVIMMTKCGRHVRWDQPHERWARARVTAEQRHKYITCRLCKGG